MYNHSNANDKFSYNLYSITLSINNRLNALLNNNGNRQSSNHENGKRNRKTYITVNSLLRILICITVLIIIIVLFIIVDELENVAITPKASSVVNNISEEIKDPEEEAIKVNDICGIATYFNYNNYETKLKNFRLFRKVSKEQGLRLITVEFSIGSFQLNNQDSDVLIQIQGNKNSQLWQKEALINIAVENLHKETCTKIVLLDIEIVYTDKNWIKKTSKLLDKYKIVQPFNRILKLSKTDTEEILLSERILYKNLGDFPIGKDEGQVECSFVNKVLQDKNRINQLKNHGYTGYVWAIRRNILEEIGGLYANSIAGGGDSLLAHAIFGHFYNRNRNVGVPYKPYYYEYRFKYPKLKMFETDYVESFAIPMYNLINHSVGSIDDDEAGMDAIHLWHGSKSNRQYQSRFDPLIKYRYTPSSDIMIDPDEHYLKFTKDAIKMKPQMIREISNIFLNRKEDS